MIAPTRPTPTLSSAARGGGKGGGRWSRYSELAEADRRPVEAACREVTEALYEGLDLGAEIRTVAARGLGDTLLLWAGTSRLAGFAVCHGGRRVRPAKAGVSSNLARCRRGPRPRAISPGSSMLVPRSPSRSACQTCWRGSTSPARRRIDIWCRAASTPRSRASRCTGRTIGATAGRALCPRRLAFWQRRPASVAAVRPVEVRDQWQTHIDRRTRIG